LLTTSTSATSSRPAFIAWTPSPVPGQSTTTTVSAASSTSYSACPTPTVSSRIVSNPKASITSQASTAARARPPRLPREAIERMNTPSSIARYSMVMR